MPPPALLVAFSEPGEAIPEVEFNDWYNNEHIPPTLSVPTFLSWRRVEAIDGKSPRWGAYYDTTSFDEIQSYLATGIESSEREKKIFAQMEYLQCRIYDVYEGAPVYPPSSLFDPNSSPSFVVFRSVEVKPEALEEYNKWMDEEHIPLLSKCPGWIRSRRFILRTSGLIGGDGMTVDPNPPPKILAIHEWAALEGMEGAEFKKAVSTEWRSRVMAHVIGEERRVFKFYKSWQRK